VSYLTYSITFSFSLGIGVICLENAENDKHSYDTMAKSQHYFHYFLQQQQQQPASRYGSEEASLRTHYI
jgi:hypothetical protein